MDRWRLRLLWRFLIGVTLIDAFDSETTLGRNCCDIRLDRIENTFAVIALPERRHESFALYLTYNPVG